MRLVPVWSMRVESLIARANIVLCSGVQRVRLAESFLGICLDLSGDKGVRNSVVSKVRVTAHGLPR